MELLCVLSKIPLIGLKFSLHFEKSSGSAIFMTVFSHPPFFRPTHPFLVTHISIITKHSHPPFFFFEIVCNPPPPPPPPPPPLSKCGFENACNSHSGQLKFCLEYMCILLNILGIGSHHFWEVGH